MKRMFLSLLLVSAAVSLMSQNIISLPKPNKNVKMTLFETLQLRHSVRSYMTKEVDDATLSQVLWAACGYNRPADKKITAASAVNAQDIEIYVVRSSGAYLYDRAENGLVLVTDRDLRTLVAGAQQAMADAPLMLVLVSNRDNFKKLNDEKAAECMGMMDVGYVSQNIYLACTSLGLGTVARATMDTKKLAEELKFSVNRVPLVNHPIGWEIVAK